MGRCETPDTLIGVGGGGSRIVYKFMEQDWILEDVLDTENYERDEPGNLEAYTVDTAVNDNWHDERYGPIDEKIKSLLEERGLNEELNNVGIEQRNLVESIPNRWLKRNDKQTGNIATPGTVRDLLNRRQMNNWWLEEGKNPLSHVERQGFDGGVYRRRAVSKAMYHINEEHGESVVPNNPGSTAMVTTLSGGTGSGVFIDLAQDLDARTIDLFAVIPSKGEKKEEKTNAFAALSELEYLWLNDETPFRTVTLIPYVGSVNDDDFEMAAVRSILAHQNGMIGGNLFTSLDPSNQNGPPEFAGFSMAVPYTMEYEVDQRESAREEIEETLSAKRTELTDEKYLYEAVEEYLEENFSSALDEVGSGIVTEPVKEQAMELRNRYERVRDELLTDDGLRVAGLEEARQGIREKLPVQEGADIIDDFEEPENVIRMTISDDDPEPEVSSRFIDRATERAVIDPTTIDNEGELGYMLASVVSQEINNIETRYELWQKIAAVTQENLDDSHALNDMEARTVRDILQDIVLSPDERRAYRDIQNPTFSETLDQVRSAKDQLVKEHQEITSLRDHVGEKVDTHIQSWRQEVEDDASHVGSVNEHQEDIVSLIDDLESAIKDRISTINDAVTEEGMHGSLAFNSFETLNQKLGAVNAERIDGDGIEEALGLVADMKTAVLEHNSGILPGRPDKSTEFSNKYRELQNLGDWFTINPERNGGDVRDPFNCVFNRSTIQRESTIEQSKQAALDRIVHAFDEQFTDGGTLIEFGPEDLTVDDPAVDMTVPTSREPAALREQLKRDLETSDAVMASTMLNEVMPLEVGGTGGETVSHELYGRYVDPFDSEVERVTTELEAYGGNDIVDDDGTIEALNRLRAISGSYKEVEDDLSVPEVTPPEEDGETYGRDFAQRYEGIYGFDIQPSVPNDGDHPYLRRGETNPEDLISSPRSIEESAVLENHEDDIFRFFANSLEDMFNNRYGRAPINNLSPRALNDQSSSPEYEGLRYIPVFMSRALEDVGDVNSPSTDSKHPRIRDKLGDSGPNDDGLELMINEITYAEEQHDIGGPDEISMVTFIGGLTLDNLSVLTDRDGYQRTYETVSQDIKFIPTHHTVGIDGKWQYWPTLHEWTRESEDDTKYGAYVFRDELRPLDRDKELITHMNDDSVEEVTEILNGMFDTGRFDGMDVRDEQAEQN